MSLVSSLDIFVFAFDANAALGAPRSDNPRSVDLTFAIATSRWKQYTSSRYG
jgi:hypothetical protein